MQKTVQPPVISIDVNAYIISHLGELDVAHQAKKDRNFAKGLPFYTCIDSAKDIWTKELSDGKTFLVKRHFDFGRDVIVDTIID